jgi:hypothetical protein
MLGFSDYGKTSIIPFTFEALANGEGSSGENADLETGSFKLLNCTWTITYFRFDSEGKKVTVGSTLKTCKDCAYNCKFTELGNCTYPSLCPVDEDVYTPGT